MKIPMRGEIWQADDVDMQYYIVSTDKFSVNCITKKGDTFGIFRISNFNFIAHHHFMCNSKIDVAQVFKEICYE